jgi:uncharacterized protein
VTVAGQSDARPAPIKMFVVKVASRCNLDCDYCYVYRHVDQTWRQQPHFLSEMTAKRLAVRVRSHALAHGLSAVDVVLHGGEPLLAGRARIARLCDTLRTNAAPVHVNLRMQTNGVLFDADWLDLCLAYDIKVGLSIDGPADANDRHRLTHSGASSFADAERAIELLASGAGQTVWSGFLAVIDLDSDPLVVYRFFRRYEPKSIEFLFPLGNYVYVPPGKGALDSTPYADWLIAIFDEWYAEAPQYTKIRRFRDIIALAMGAETSSEEWGLQPVDFVVVESDGSLQAVDTLKVTFERANHLGLSIHTHEIDALYESPIVRERQNRWAALCDTCRSCELVRVCGGGYFPHRYSSTNGFLNPSVYCADLKKLIRHVLTAVSRDLRHEGALAAAAMPN